MGQNKFPYKRTIVFGSTGVGKTTLVKRISEDFGVPGICMDSLRRESGRSDCPEQTFSRLVTEQVKAIPGSWMVLIPACKTSSGRVQKQSSGWIILSGLRSRGWSSAASIEYSSGRAAKNLSKRESSLPLSVRPPIWVRSLPKGNVVNGISLHSTTLITHIYILFACLVLKMLNSG